MNFFIFLTFFWLQHDQIYDAVLQLDFYQLPIKEQNFYRFYIIRCQEPTLLTFGGFAPLNLETSVQVHTRQIIFAKSNRLIQSLYSTDLFENLFVYNAHLYYGNGMKN